MPKKWVRNSKPRRRKLRNLYTNEMDVEHTVQEYIGSLSGYQSDALPVDQLFKTTENLTYVARNEKGTEIMGIDPHWDHERVFQGHIRMPLDRKAKNYGFIWSEHIYNVNPLAGTGTENVDFLAGGVEQQLNEMNLLPTIAAQQGNPYEANVTNMLDSDQVSSQLHSAEQTKEILEEYRQLAPRGGKLPGGSIVLDPGEKLLQSAADINPEIATQKSIINRNILESQGIQFVNDPAGRHDIFTHNGQPIQYYLDGSIVQAHNVEQDALETEPVDSQVGPYEWLNWHGYDLPQNRPKKHRVSTAVKGTLDEAHENLNSNNPCQIYLSGAMQHAADEYTMKSTATKQMFLDYDRPFDPLPLYLIDANDDMQDQRERNLKALDLSRMQ